MHILDLIVFGAYLVGLLGIGAWFFRRDESASDYYLGGRQMGSLHIGLSVVATDVGGGFSIGLGGLGFTMGLAGSWMLFTGLIGAWLAAVWLIPRVKPNAAQYKFLTFPDLFGYHFGPREAVVAGVISAVGYLGFTSSQIVAGAKLASAVFPEVDYGSVLAIIGVIVVGYTALGGLKAVVYTDTFQWIILMVGLVFVGIPVAYVAIGGWAAISTTLEPSFFDLTAIEPVQLFNWFITIVPIWFVAMTLYQRIYATRTVKEAQRAWYIAGLFEWPIMAFMGVTLGLFARVAADQGMFAAIGFASAAGMDPEMGLPILLRTVLPVGVMGLLMAAYFSAIMSTADSCLLAASGNVLSDLLVKFGLVPKHSSSASRLVTVALGAVAVVLALYMESVLTVMLYSYAFMVSGLLVPVLAILVGRTAVPSAALGAMVVGGGVTILLSLGVGAGQLVLPLGLDPNAFGLSAATVTYAVVYRIGRPV
ncbi:MAG: SSS family solute:Na+ symporter [Rhodothermales bacterium]|jgi:SSS family solute:Na+ symporter